MRDAVLNLLARDRSITILYRLNLFRRGGDSPHTPLIAETRVIGVSHFK